MSSEVFWIKLQTSTFDSESIMLLESMPEGDTLLIIWLKMQILAGKCNACGYLLLNGERPYSDEMLATVFRRPLNTVRLAITAFLQFNMVEIVDGSYFLPDWEIYQNVSGMDKIREQTRARVARYRGNKKNVTLQVTQGNATETETKIETEKQQQEIRLSMENTPFSRITEQELRKLTDRHGCKQVSVSADIAAETWRRNHKEIHNPFGYLLSLCESHTEPEFYEPPEGRNAKLAAAVERKRTEAVKIKEQHEREEREAQERNSYWISLSEAGRRELREDIRKSSPFLLDFKDDEIDGIAKVNAWENRLRMSTNVRASI